MKIKDLQSITVAMPSSPVMPVLFIGHGHPMNALYNNDFTKSLRQLGHSLEKPSAILVISAHWETRGTFVSVNPKPATIYDFGNFDPRLFQLKYEVAGHPELARQLIDTATPFQIHQEAGMGLDHGAWTVLLHLFPEKNIPVFQLSLDYSQTPAYHYQLGRALRNMRQKGLMIIASGNIVHNLHELDWYNLHATPHDWALEFDTLVKDKLDRRQFNQLIHYQQLGKAATRSVPSNEHYLPMLYTLGLADEKDQLKHVFEGFQHAGISMRAFCFSRS